MQIFKNIFGRIWAVWGIIAFVATMLIIFIPVWACGLWPEPKASDKLILIFRGWMRVFIPLIGCRLVVKGKENFKKGENYIVLCNHNSLMDVPLSSPEIRGPNKTIAKIEMSRIPIFGIIYKRGSVLVDRKDPDSRRNSYEKMRKVLEQGMHMCIYPEGTRNKGSQPLQPFKDGAFKLAMETGKPFLPTLIFHTNKVLPNNKAFYLMPHRLEIHFLPPVYIQAGDTEITLKEKLFHLMETYYVEHNH
jgi:1-acyl-sn-glycerol-3-phosphate acyltransferase